MGADDASKRDKSEILDLFGNIRALRRKLWVWAAGTLRKSLGVQAGFLKNSGLQPIENLRLISLESWESLEMSPRPDTSKVLRIIPKANFPRNACELEIFNNLRFDFAKGIFFLRRNSPKPLRGDLIGERYCSIVSLQVP